jgi:hypothetical protein
MRVSGVNAWLDQTFDLVLYLEQLKFSRTNVLISTSAIMGFFDFVRLFLMHISLVMFITKGNDNRSPRALSVE